VHLYVLIVCRRVSDHCDVVAQLKRITNSCFHTRVCNKTNHYELMDAMSLELQIQIGVSETTGTPMLLNYNLTRLRCELLADLTSPRAVFERLARPGPLLDGRNVLQVS